MGVALVQSTIPSIRITGLTRSGAQIAWNDYSSEDMLLCKFESVPSFLYVRVEETMAQ